MSDRNPTNIDPIARAVDGLQTEIRTILPAQIVAYNFATQRATVQAGIKCRLTDGKVLPLPPVVDAPVRWPRGGGWHIHWNLLPGDTVHIMCSDRALDGWLAKGGLVDPVDRRRHALTDAIVVPGLSIDTDPHKGVGLPTDAVFGREDGTVELRLSELGTAILAASVLLQLGGPTAALGVARATDPTLLNAGDLVSINALIALHNVAVPLGPILAGGVALAPVTGLGTITAGSTKVVSE